MMCNKAAIALSRNQNGKSMPWEEASCTMAKVARMAGPGLAVVEGDTADECAKNEDALRALATGCGWTVIGIERQWGMPSLDMRKFDRLYDRDSHVRLVYDVTAAALSTAALERHHVLLYGSPAGAKSELFRCFRDWLGERFVFRVNAGTLTKAGLEIELYNRAVEGRLPPVLLIEEIEKGLESNLACLIQIMDREGTIQRTNCFGDKVERCPVLVWATCNNLKKLSGWFDGALLSRFAWKMYCDRPDRERMKRILQRRVEEIEGKEEWIKPILDYCYDEIKLEREHNDPRFALALLAGRNRAGLLEDTRAVRLSKAYMKELSGDGESTAVLCGEATQVGRGDDAVPRPGHGVDGRGRVPSAS